MSRRNKLIAGVIGAVLVVGVGTGVVMAAAGDDDKPLSGSKYDQATEAALDHVGGGEVIETEVGDDGAAYGVEIRKDDGSVVEVNLDSDFNVIGDEPDDDGAGDEDDGAGDEDDGPNDD
jgi:hypothetical protein